MTASAKFTSIESVTSNLDDIFLLPATNNRILHFIDTGGFLASFGTEGQNSKQFQNPTVADSDNRIQKFASISTPSKLEIPEWIKNNAKWWSENQIDDDSFIQGIEFLIKEKILSVSVSSSNTEYSQDIPEWIKNNAGWWANGTISEDDFVNGLEYLIENGIINTRWFLFFQYV